MADHIQAKLVTQDEKYKIADTMFELPGEVTVTELTNLVNKVLKEGVKDAIEDENEYQNMEFDFLVNGEFLRIPLNQYIENKGISTEKVVEIEYILKQESPKPEDQFTQDDWISSVQSTKEFILTGSYDCTVSIWNMDSSKPCIYGFGHTEPVKAVSWVNRVNNDKTAYLISSSQDQSAILWQWEKGEETVKPLFCCRGHSKSVDCVSVHPEMETFATGSWDSSIKLWSTSPVPQDDSNEPEDFRKARNKKKRQRIEQRGVTRVPKSTLAGHREAVSSLVWLSSSDLCSVSWDHTINVWDINEGKEKLNLRGAKVFLACDYSFHSNLLATGSSDRHIRIWDPRGKDEIFSKGSLIKCNLTSHTGWITCVKWSPSNQYQLVSGSLDYTVKLWDIRSPQTPLFDVNAHQDKVMCLDWSNDDIIFSGGADKNLYKFRYNSVS
uniref:ribosome biogenesis protein wdr12-like n=1 Tax=Styela clava TaxID=7725 RepID=UPI00193A9057|nr:ribosome biogenesis protein wdr12-like [Styela clava]XP_039252871.1 ribosome biogenesis protein wdr12-like [Styela clava]